MSSGSSSSSSRPPIDPLFENVFADKESEKERLEKLKKILPQLQDSYNRAKEGRSQYFYPYLLVRSKVGDRGNRPLNDVFWESPDIWIAEGEPRNTPPIPSATGGTARSGVAHTVYAHVWNLGRAPIAGVRAEFNWFNPSFTFSQSTAHPIGIARVDLGPRTSLDCHKLVKCPNAWIPQIKHGRAAGSDVADECIVVRVSSIGDTISAEHPWDAWADRHVAQRNILIVSRGGSVSPLLDSLDKSRVTDGKVQLVQVGEEGKNAVTLVAPDLKVDASIKTQVLAELRVDGAIFLPWIKRDLRSPDRLEEGSRQPIINANVLLNVGLKTEHDENDISLDFGPQEADGFQLLKRNGDLTSLIQHMNSLPGDIKNKIPNAKLPKDDEAQVLRLILSKENQMVGGYTIIVAGKE